MAKYTRPVLPQRGTSRCNGSRSELAERGDELFDVVFVVVEVYGCFSSATSAAGSASPTGTDTMLLRFAPRSSTGVHPSAASRLIELSKRDAVGDRSIVGPKKLSNGIRPLSNLR